MKSAKTRRNNSASNVTAEKKPGHGPLLRASVLGGVTMLGSLIAHAEGFRNPPPGTFDLGRAGGRIAQVDDSSAVQQNPANIIDLLTPQLQFTPTVVYIHADYRSPSGQTASTKDPWKFLPNLFATMPLYDGKLALGLGVTVPYGLGNEWNTHSSAYAFPTGAWRYQAPYLAQLTTYNVNPTIALKANDHLSLGAGLDVMYSQVSLRQFFPWFLATENPASPDGHVAVNADGIGAGANFGATIRVTEHQRLALTVRTPIRVDYQGHFEVNNVPAPLGGGQIRDQFKTSIKFPTILAAGYGIDLTDKIRVETDVEWLQFSNFKSLELNSAAASSLGFPKSIPENWRDTFTVGIGGDWKFATNWVARASYQYYESPVPDSTF
ncbi:MAG TPA: outer membrane protein transport protein, partial [Verrucomicrobiae bacterium]|nr:outer membrane protein transport protein [Verrucomicrobiae bacterium]